MEEEPAIECFVKEPNLLVELCRKVIGELDASYDDSSVGNLEVKLREIATAIEQLDSVKVVVPDLLRVEKERLERDWALLKKAATSRNQLILGLHQVLAEIETPLNALTHSFDLTAMPNPVEVCASHQSQLLKGILVNWRTLNKRLHEFDEGQVLAMLRMEMTGAKRVSALERLHQRYNTMRVERERLVLLGRRVRTHDRHPVMDENEAGS